MKGSFNFANVVSRYLDGNATAEEIAWLDARLRTDAQAREAFAEMVNLDSAIAEIAASSASEKEIIPFNRPQITARQHARRPFIRWIGMAAAALALIAGGSWWQSQGRKHPYATVASDAGAAGLPQGKEIHTEEFELAAGTVELMTKRGARIVVEAPAAFRFESDQRLHLKHGRVAAHVPPAAKGFTVITPTGKVVDLGTDFGVDVPRSGTAEIHVFNGEVIALPSNGSRQNLRDGEAFTLQPGGGSAREMRSAAFIRPEEMAGLSAGVLSGQQARSDAFNATLREDPALIALLDFESNVHEPGTYHTVQGRWPGSRAPEFVQVGDRLKLDVGGGRTWPRFTLATWVRIDRLGAPYQSLYHTDGWYEGKNPGQVHWMINRDMTMRLALRENTLPPDTDDRYGFPDSRTSVLPEQGRWIHLAVVYDSEARTVRFYLNGRFDKESIQQVALPARFGPAQIGNWDSNDRKLSGRVDELLILGRAMSDAEIQSLFNAGNPYQ